MSNYDTFRHFDKVEKDLLIPKLTLEYAGVGHFSQLKTNELNRFANLLPSTVELELSYYAMTSGDAIMFIRQMSCLKKTSFHAL